MPGSPGRRAVVKVPGAPLVLTNAATTNAGDNKTYQITTAANRVLDPNLAVTVKIGGTVASPTGADPFTVNRLSGTVTFTNASAGRAAVTVSGSYLPLGSAARARNYAYTLAATNADDTDFDSANTNGGFISRVQVQLDVSGTIGGKWSIDTFLRDALLNASLVVVEFYPDRTLTRDLACWATLSKSGVTAAVDAVNDYDVEFQGTTDADGRAASK
jgi:hypothetical protein